MHNKYYYSSFLFDPMNSALTTCVTTLSYVCHQATRWCGMQLNQRKKKKVIKCS